MQHTDTSGSSVELPWFGGVDFVCRFALGEDKCAIDDGLAVSASCQEVQGYLPIPKDSSVCEGHGVEREILTRASRPRPV
jgi:hypothetical protein